MLRTDDASKSRRCGAKRYQLQSVGRACSVLKAFGDNEERLTLSELAARTGLEKTIAFRLLQTLETQGFLRRVGAHRYCRSITIRDNRVFRIGYAAERLASPFAATVSEGLRWAAARNGVDLILLDNRGNAETAIQNAERLIGEQVDLAIEFQEFAKIAPKVASIFHDSGIPLIAVGVPHPGAIFYGIDNFRVGRAAGRALVKWAKRNWRGEADGLLLLGDDNCGSLPHLRLSGAEAVIREMMPSLGSVQYLDTLGKFSRASEAVRRHLRFNTPRRTMVVGFNDEATLGGLEAFEQFGCSELCAAVALEGTARARLELRLPASRLIACIAFFPERYGECLIRLALEVLHKRPVPPSIYVEVETLTAENVDQFYPS